MHHNNTYQNGGLFFSFSVSQDFKISTKKTDKKEAKNSVQVLNAVFFSNRYMHVPKQFKTAWKTKFYICWSLDEVWTSFNRAVNTWKNKLTIKQTDNCQIYIRIPVINLIWCNCIYPHIKINELIQNPWKLSLSLLQY